MKSLGAWLRVPDLLHQASRPRSVRRSFRPFSGGCTAGCAPGACPVSPGARQHTQEAGPRRCPGDCGVHPVTHCGAPSEALWTPFSTLGLCDVTRPRRQACWPLAPARCSPASSLGLALGQQPCAPPGRGQSGVPRPDGLSPKPGVGLTQHHAVVCMAGDCSELCRDSSQSQSLEKRQHRG